MHKTLNDFSFIQLDIELNPTCYIFYSYHESYILKWETTAEVNNITKFLCSFY
jgi:hypothetical protein